MEPRFFRFVWRYSKRDQLIILFLTVISFPLVYFSLEIPKIIINDAIDGEDFPVDILGVEFEQIPYLLLLCGLFLLMVVLINGIKWLMNVQVGMTGERMLRRLRFMLFERVMRFKIIRFRSTKPGEVIQSILGEIEPLGGFIGEVLATPCFQGGLLGVYVTFIFVQDWMLGLAAIALYPIQAYIIPILQAKIVRLNKERARNTRVLADTIGEGVNTIAEINTNDTARWHLAQVAGRLYSNTVIRLQLFRRKFTIKFINNFLNQLTPFFFYSVGGYLVIKGDLQFGSLVAVLAAYKDVAAPWKAVLNYMQRWTDFNSRYLFVVEAFSDDVMDEERIYAKGEAALPLGPPLEFADVEGGPGTGGLVVSRLKLDRGAVMAVAGGAGGAREALLKLAVGLAVPTSGRVTLGGRQIIDCTLPQIGGSVSFVGADPGIVARSMRDNLLYGLFRGEPDLAGTTDETLADMLDEAQRTGNSTANPDGDWVDYQIAGLADAEALGARLLELVELVGLSSEVYSGALGMRIEGDAGPWTERITRAREYLHKQGEDLSDIVEFWEPERFNTNATLLDNVLYALPATGSDDPAIQIDNPAVVALLDEIGATDELVAIGRDIAKEFSELVDGVEADSGVLDSFAGYRRSDILAAHELIVATAGAADALRTPEHRKLLIKLALGFVQVRDRLDVLDDSRIERLLAARAKARELIDGRDDFVSIDETRFNPSRDVAGNILRGLRRYDRRSAWKHLEAMIEDAITRAGLRDDLIRLGLSRPVTSSSLSTSTRRRIALVRALIKRPAMLVLDGIAGSENAADVELRRAIREALPDTMILYAALEASAVEIADTIAIISDDGQVRCEKRENAADN